MDLLTHTIAALVGGGAVYLWMRPQVVSPRGRALLAEAAAERDALQSELTRLTDRDELGRYKKDDPQ